MDQVFVKAFSRRNRGAQQQNAAPEAVEPSQEPGSNEQQASRQQGSLHVDQSVANTAEIWVDPIEDQIARADHASESVPPPHVDPIATNEPRPTSAGGVQNEPPPEHVADSDGTATVETNDTERLIVEQLDAAAQRAQEEVAQRAQEAVAQRAQEEVAQRAQEAVADASALLSQYQNAVEDTVQLSHIHTAYAGSYEELSVVASAPAVHEAAKPVEDEVQSPSEDVVGDPSVGHTATTEEPTREPEPCPSAGTDTSLDFENRLGSAPTLDDVDSRIETHVERMPEQAAEAPAMMPERFESAQVADPQPVAELQFQEESESEQAVVEPPIAAETIAAETVATEPVNVEANDSAATETAPDPLATYVPFQAVWEVDVFDVPTPVADLFFEGALFQQIAERMSDAVGSGLKNVLITSTKPGEGRSSVAIGMAMAAAAAGIRVALVDADTESPTLADELRLDLQYGWVDVIRRGLPIKEIAVHAVEDGVTLIPLMPPGVRPAATAFEMVQLVDLLRNNFELIILDGPTSLSPGLHQCASKVDSAVIVRDINSTDTLAVSELANRLQGSGVRGVGVVENFV